MTGFSRAIGLILVFVLVASVQAFDDSPAERGRKALTGRSFIGPAWSESAFAKAGSLWGSTYPDPEKSPEKYAEAFAAFPAGKDSG